MNVYDVFRCVDEEIKEVINCCLRNVHREDRESARDWYHHITVAFPFCVEEEPSTYAMLCVVCPDKICRVLAVDTAHIDEYFQKDAAGIISSTPDLQEIPFPKLLGMEVSLDNLIEVGYKQYAAAFLRALMPGVDHCSYWTLRCDKGGPDDKLDACIKNALNYIE